MRHGDHDVVGRFSGPEERRQLFARDLRGARDAELVFIPEGGAEGLRESCRAGHLVCPVADCPDPRYIAKGGSRRHHFAHHGGSGGHAPESFYHQVGKQLLAAHIRKRQPQAEVTVEGRVENGQVADVLVRSPQTGRRYAFELQYSPLTVEAWRARHEGYCALGIIDCWLLGHTPPHLRPAAGAGLGFVALTPLVAELFRQGLPVIFLDPDEQAVATSLLQCHLHQLRWGGQLREDVPQETPERAAALRKGTAHPDRRPAAQSPGEATSLGGGCAEPARSGPGRNARPGGRHREVPGGAGSRGGEGEAPGNENAKSRRLTSGGRESLS